MERDRETELLRAMLAVLKQSGKKIYGEQDVRAAISSLSASDAEKAELWQTVDRAAKSGQLASLSVH